VWVYDNKVFTIFQSQQFVKELLESTKGCLLLFEIPANLKPSLPPVTQIKKDDSNNGIDSTFTKIVVHIFKDGQLLNLPRIIYADKTWSLKKMHLEFFILFRDLIY